MMNSTRAMLIWAFLCLWLLHGCGDPLADIEFRGEALFTRSGSTEPLPDVSGAEFLCSNKLFACNDVCDLYEDPSETDSITPPGPSDDEAIDEDSIEPLTAVEACFDQCYLDYEKCMLDNDDTGFSEAYYESQDAQRIAILWANPGDAPLGALQQRTVTQTAFPARYTFTVYHPPNPAVLFESDEGAFAFGIVVSFIDRNRNEILDWNQEPIIGINENMGILYHQEGSSVGYLTAVEKGYQSFRKPAACLNDASDGEQNRSGAQSGNTISIVGATPRILEQLPDVDCDDDRDEWRRLCTLPQVRSRCTAPTDETSELSAFSEACYICDLIP